MLESFQRIFGSGEGVRVFRAPGRVNLIGEHTDYNLGFVLPVALRLATWVAAAPSPDGKLRIFSEHRNEMREFDSAGIADLRPSRSWTDYPIGVAHELIQAGFPVEPANLLIRSTVPEGSGLSSSAALEVSSALALLNGRKPADPLDLALLCQRAERNFVGMPCGIMDQYISVFGREHSAVEIDCRSLGRRFVPLPEGIAFVAVNTMVKHALAGSAYSDRVRECAEALNVLQTRFPGIESLRDATPEMIEAAGGALPEVACRRARHVVTENGRVSRFVDAAQRADLELMGTLMVKSHRSLQRDYEVSCPELDFIVDAAADVKGVLGARMTGGGFGGCAVVLLRTGSEPAFAEHIRRAYAERFGLTPEIYPCEPSEGAGESDVKQAPCNPA